MKKVVDKQKMAIGYMEMANINLKISQEDYHLEAEGEKYIYEMDTKGMEGNAQ